MPSQEAELFVLLETAAGFVLTHVKEWDSIVHELQNVQDSLLDSSKYVTTQTEARVISQQNLDCSCF